MNTQPLDICYSICNDRAFEPHSRIRRDIKDEFITPVTVFTLFDDFELPLELKNVSKMIEELGEEPFYHPFVKWLFAHMSDTRRHEKRMRVIKQNPPLKILEIVKDAPFPVPQNFRQFYAHVVHADQVVGDDNEDESIGLITLPT